jgi:hypothetical protein
VTSGNIVEKMGADLADECECEDLEAVENVVIDVDFSDTVGAPY